MSTPAPQRPASEASPETAPLRFVTAATLFDGHDAAINIMRRIIQSQGAEVIHLGHNRSVEDVVRAALQEDADAIALSAPTRAATSSTSSTWWTCCSERGAGHIRVFGGGGGTITPEEIARAAGLRRRAHLPPQRRHALGLAEMIEDVVQRTARQRRGERENDAAHRRRHRRRDLRSATCSRPSRKGMLGEAELAQLRKQWELAGKQTPVLGITGTGGAGKSSVVDELLLRFLHAFPEMRIAVLAVDPTRRRTGGALLGDRIRMNSLRSPARVHALDGHAPPARRHQRDAARLRRLPARPGLRPGHRRDRRHRPVAIPRSWTWSISRST